MSDEAFSEHEPVTGSDTAQRSQAEMDAEMAAVIEGYEAGKAEHGEETQPRLDYPPYRSSVLRHPTKDPHHADPETIELYAPVFGQRDVDPLEADLTIQHHGEPIGERIVVTGRVLDGDGRPVRAPAGGDLAGQRRAAATCTSATSTRRRSTRTSPASAAA